MSGKSSIGRTLGLRAAIAAALLACVSPWEAGAQQQERRAIARLKSVTGNVLVSRDTGLAAGAQAERLPEGTRIITTANSEATVEFDDGCEVHLKENERLDVESGRPCAALAGTPLGAPVAAVGVPILTYLLPVVAPAVLADNETQGATPVSPN